MPVANVLVVFYSRTGVTETLALATGVGAVQARGTIRLRRIPDAADERTISAHASWIENRQRMNKEYIPPRDEDIEWADAIILAAPHGFDASSAEIRAFLASLRTYGADRKLSKKIGGAFLSTSLTEKNDAGVASILSTFAAVGMTVVPAPESDGEAEHRSGATPKSITPLNNDTTLAQSYGKMITLRAAALKPE
jgi:multimeric flavodoxin WrbA